MSVLSRGAIYISRYRAQPNRLSLLSERRALNAMKERWSHGRGFVRQVHIHFPLPYVDSETQQLFASVRWQEIQEAVNTSATPLCKRCSGCAPGGSLFIICAEKPAPLCFFHASISETSPFMKRTLSRNSMHFPSPIEAAHVPVSL